MNNIQLHLGDCVEYMRSMEENSVDAIVTDPPYGIDYQSAWRIDSLRFPKINGDKNPDFVWLEIVGKLAKSVSCLFIFSRWDVERHFVDAVNNNGWIVQSEVIWNRGIHGLGDLKKQFAPMHDNCIFATKGNYEFPSKRPKDVYTIDRVSANELLHPTQKPTALMCRIIKDITKSDSTILDPFMGSGTTGVACVRLNRHFIGCEIDPDYFAIAEKRIREAQMQLGLGI